MDRYKPKEIPAQPARTEQVYDHTTCDLCGKRVEQKKGNAEEVEVKHRTGSSYPEGGSGEETSIDMCGDCFDTRLIPWLKEQGAKPITEEWDW